jgi:hypothetical protein
MEPLLPQRVWHWLCHFHLPARHIADSIGGGWVVATTCSSVLASCVSGDRHIPRLPVVRDSSGIEIVENVPQAWRDGDGWRMSDKPSLQIGQAEGSPEYEFHRIVGGTRLGNGKIVIGDQGSQEVRVFDSDGLHLSTFGGHGGGPREFLGLAMIAPLSDDSLLAFDVVRNRATVFAESGMLLLEQTFETGEFLFP